MDRYINLPPEDECKEQMTDFVYLVSRNAGLLMTNYLMFLFDLQGSRFSFVLKSCETSLNSGTLHLIITETFSS